MWWPLGDTMSAKRISELYIIPGDPTPLARARFTRDRVFDSQKHAKFAWGILLRNQHDESPFFCGPLGMDIVFFMPIAASSSSKKKASLMDKFHISKPDISNLLKFLEDCAQGILYNDDCIISQISCKKIYSDNPRTEFKVFEL
jgi:Holliday junction resolvase RusA-like endonuclease